MNNLISDKTAIIIIPSELNVVNLKNSGHDEVPISRVRDLQHIDKILIENTIMRFQTLKTNAHQFQERYQAGDSIFLV